eukprot:COSAG02_NODE_9198_length_2291_cov_6.816318_3_plen_58_part_01
MVLRIVTNLYVYIEPALAYWCHLTQELRVDIVVAFLVIDVAEIIEKLFEFIHLVIWHL